MTKKQINIALIIVVLTLWGTVLYKYVNRFFSNEEVTYNQTNFSLPIAKIEKDSFKLYSLSRDPFLGKTLIKKDTKVIRNKTTSKPVVKKHLEPKQDKPYPLVQYFGYIKSQDKSEKLILLKVNNKLEKVRLNGDVEGLIVKKIYKDSVLVMFNNVIKSFKKG